MKLYKSINAYACNINCRDGFRCDRKNGLIYGPFKYTDGSFAMNAEEFSRETESCVYCGEDKTPTVNS